MRNVSTSMDIFKNIGNLAILVKSMYELFLLLLALQHLRLGIPQIIPYKFKKFSTIADFENLNAYLNLFDI